MPKAVGSMTRCMRAGERARRSALLPPAPAPEPPAAAAWPAAAREVVRLHGAPLTHLLAVGRALVSASADGVLLVSLLGAGAGAGAPGGPAGSPARARPRGLRPPRGSVAPWAACAQARVLWNRLRSVRPCQRRRCVAVTVCAGAAGSGSLRPSAQGCPSP